jgi:hypothetical protein
MLAPFGLSLGVGIEVYGTGSRKIACPSSHVRSLEGGPHLLDRDPSWMFTAAVMLKGSILTVAASGNSAGHPHTGDCDWMVCDTGSRRAGNVQPQNRRF